MNFIGSHSDKYIKETHKLNVKDGVIVISNFDCDIDFDDKGKISSIYLKKTTLLLHTVLKQYSNRIT